MSKIIGIDLGTTNSLVATVDSGAHMFAATNFWQAVSPAEFLISNGLATMGFALPAAIAAQLVYPDRHVLAFTGDGGFMMAVAELETAVREHLPIVEEYSFAWFDIGSKIWIGDI